MLNKVASANTYLTIMSQFFHYFKPGHLCECISSPQYHTGVAAELPQM